MVDGERKLTPCSPGDPAAKEMTYADVESDELYAPHVDLKDFKMALQESHPTVSQDDVQKQVDWTNEFGSEGA
jgi:vacuolar protein-sorting-associated protein 4